MHRLAALLVCTSLGAVGLVAAPAPVYRPERARWLGMADWDKPVNPGGDCRFDREREKLTITIPPGKNRLNDFFGYDVNGPCLLRRVVGNFAVQVRVDGQFGPGTEGGRRAGLLVGAGEHACLLHRATEAKKGMVWNRVYGFLIQPGEREFRFDTVTPPHGAAHLRIERRGDTLLMTASRDGLKWSPVGGGPVKKLPGSLKVGVYAESTLSVSFKPVFDRFKLTAR